MAPLLWAAERKADRRGDPVHGYGLRSLGATVVARCAQHRSGGRLGRARGRGAARDACPRRPRMPAADRARGSWRDADRAGAGLSWAAQSRCVSASVSTLMRYADRTLGRSILARDRRGCRKGIAVMVAEVRPVVARSLVPRPRDSTTSRAIVNAHFRTRLLPGKTPANDRNAERHHRMGVRLPGPALGHHQRGRSAHRHAARRTGADDLARGRGVVAGRRPVCSRPLADRARAACATFSATPEAGCAPPRRENRIQNLELAGDWTETGLPATDRKCHPVRPPRRRSLHA